MRTRKKRSTFLLIALSVVAALFVAPLLHDVWRMRSLRGRAKAVKIGDSKTQVQNLLGQPNAMFARGSGLLDGAVFGLIPKTPEQWAYGKRFEYHLAGQFPYLYLGRFRFFGPDADDVAIQFDRKGKVSAVITPSSPSSQPALPSSQPNARE